MYNIFWEDSSHNTFSKIRRTRYVLMIKIVWIEMTGEQRDPTFLTFG